MANQRKDDIKYATNIDTTPSSIKVNSLGNRDIQETKAWTYGLVRLFYYAYDVPARYFQGKN